ncbi:MAG: FtsX-like permease family protein [Paludibacteraceae bacterium]|nr:FtsX-like permease family protein [Paludibacteraceae bacterium]
MNFPFYIARRYLLAKKSVSAINIISAISVCGVAVGTMALVCVLSVFNGFQGLVEDLFSNFDPEIKVTAVGSKVFDPDSVLQILESDGRVALTSCVLEENALLQFGKKQMPVMLKGVSDDYAQVTDIEQILYDGEYKLREGDFYMAVGGVGLVHTLGSGMHYVRPLELYAPKRTKKVNLMRPDKSFNKEIVFMSGVFMVRQDKYDNNLLIVPIDLAGRLFEYESQVSSIELRLKSGTDIKSFKKDLRAKLGAGFAVKDKYEQQEDFFKMMEIEKWVTYLILSFILLIAAFNIIGSLSMLIIDKKDDIKYLQYLGARPKTVFRIFLYEGWLISIIGAVVGVLFGLLLCWLQAEFGWVRVNSGGSYIVDAYPVKVQVMDIIIIFVTVLALGFVSALYPARQVAKVEE